MYNISSKQFLKVQKMNNLKSHILEIKKDSIVSDMALGFEPEIEVSHKWNLLDRYLDSGINYVGLAVAGEFTTLDTTMHYLSQQKNIICANQDKFIIVKNTTDIIRAKKENKLAVGLWFQGSNPIANDLNMIQTYYDLGIRYMLLAYNTRNHIGDGVIEKSDAGLSSFGKKVIEEMNRVGMIIDLSHTGIKTSLEAIELSQHPVIFSHSNTQSVTPHIRNLTDEQIKSLAKNNGVIGINSLALFLGTEKSSAPKIVEHINYITNLVGTSDNIALGLDQVYFHEILEDFYRNHGGSYPSGYLGAMDSLPPEKIDEIIEELLKQNYTTNSIKDILGNNFMRVAATVWKEEK